MRWRRRRRVVPPAMGRPEVEVSIQREHAWEPPTPMEFTLTRNGTISNVNQITFGPFDSKRPQMIHGFRSTWPNGAVIWGSLCIAGGMAPRPLPPGASLTFLPGQLVISLT